MPDEEGDHRRFRIHILNNGNTACVEEDLDLDLDLDLDDQNMQKRGRGAATHVFKIQTLL
jgi:hypothetical protein